MTASETAFCRSTAMPRAYADIAAKSRFAGRPITPMDCQIAATARSRAMAVATHNIRDFKDIGIKVVDPWATV